MPPPRTGRTSDLVAPPDPSQIPDYPLPTLDNLHATIPSDLDAHTVLCRWFDEFTTGIKQYDTERICSLFLPDNSFWHDLLALTWDFRLFHGPEKIKTFLNDQLRIFSPRKLELETKSVNIQRPYGDLIWITSMFNFETTVGSCSGVIRLVPTRSGLWKAHVVSTNLEDLHGYPEKVGPLRNPRPNHGHWLEQRQAEVEFKDRNPTVVIIGAGQSGLILAARLRALEISVLIIERNSRVGDNWRNRYEALCLHDPIWFDHMPYMPFPSTWPVYTPARKFAGWLEHYAETMEIPIWTSATVTRAVQNSENRNWHLSINCTDGSMRELSTNHLVFATGLGDGVPKAFDCPGLDQFKGEYLYSTEFKSALDHTGKKVVVVGSGTSAHDIAKDCYDHGIDVTMVQRGATYVMSTDPGWGFLFKGTYWEGGPPVDILDRSRSGLPRPVALEYLQRQVQQLSNLDKELLDGLRSVGFKLSSGDRGAGAFWSAFSRSGGYYIDVGASKLIIDKKIKLKNDSTISEVRETGLVFADGSELPADVIVFATGVGDVREIVRRVCGNDVARRTKPVWGLDQEAEVNSVWRDSGVENMWYAFGNLSFCRFHSKHLALQIKAKEEGVFGKRYSICEVLN